MLHLKKQQHILGVFQYFLVEKLSNDKKNYTLEALGARDYEKRKVWELGGSSSLATAPLFHETYTFLTVLVLFGSHLEARPASQVSEQLWLESLKTTRKTILWELSELETMKNVRFGSFGAPDP